jgi:hypothetical protein
MSNMDQTCTISTDPNERVCFRLRNPDTHVINETTTLLLLRPINIEFLEQRVVHELVKGSHHLKRLKFTFQWYFESFFWGGGGRLLSAANKTFEKTTKFKLTSKNFSTSGV